MDTSDVGSAESEQWQAARRGRSQSKAKLPGAPLTPGGRAATPARITQTQEGDETPGPAAEEPVTTHLRLLRLGLVTFTASFMIVFDRGAGI